MSLQTFMIDALQNATQMIREEGAVRPTFLVCSAEGLYSVVCQQSALEPDDACTLQVVSSLLRWSLTRAFVVTCEHRAPARIGVYIITERDVEGFSVSVRRRPLRFGDPIRAQAPPDIQRLRALVPSPISRLSASDVLDLEEVFGMELDECRPIYVN